jgi:hypothetical protein
MTDKWIDAIMAADDDHDLAQLADLIDSDAPLSNHDRRLLADLLRRHRLQDLSGGPKLPVDCRGIDRHLNVIAAALVFESQRGPWPGKAATADDTEALLLLADQYKCHDIQIRNWLENSGSVFAEFGHLINSWIDDSATHDEKFDAVSKAILVALIKGELPP